MRAQPITIAGIDRGRSTDWIWIAKYHVPENNRYNTNQISDNTFREVLYASDIVKTDIPQILEEYRVKFGLIDNEPDIESSARLCQITCLEMADQKHHQLEEYKKATVIDGGIEYPCWKIRNNKFLKQVQNLFILEHDDGYPIIKLPDSWEKWLNNKSERSPIRHLTSPEYNPESNKWDRSDHIDDLYYACAFCEAAFFIYIDTKQYNENIFVC